LSLITNPASNIARRTFLGRTACGIGSAALASLLGGNRLRAAEAAALATRGVINSLQFAPRAKRIIFLTMAGGPSHLETLDYKPKLAEMHGQPMPESFTKGQPIAQLQGKELKCLAPQHAFQKHGNRGRKSAKSFHGLVRSRSLCIVCAAYRAINHDPAHTL
jgi:hypothetical protein